MKIIQILVINLKNISPWHEAAVKHCCDSWKKKNGERKKKGLDCEVKEQHEESRKGKAGRQKTNKKGKQKKGKYERQKGKEIEKLEQKRRKDKRKKKQRNVENGKQEERNKQEREPEKMKDS